VNPKRKQRLIIILCIVVGIALATTFTLMALEENLNAFYTPVDIHAGKANANRTLRVGGLVVTGSVQRETGELAVEFTITDNEATIPVRFEGILPDLFKEGQGIIAIGRLKNSGTDQVFVQADEVLAKHDENYMSPELKAAMEEKGVYVAE
jgi:cytochrome c-type biogenesis protein CcmE